LAKFGLRLPRLRHMDKILPFVLVVVCTVSAVFLEDLAVLSLFVVAVAICAWRRFDPGMIVGAAVLIVVSYAVLSVSGLGNYVNKVLAWAYCFAVVGVIGLLTSDSSSAT
jgi:hypothetical protein